MTYVPGTLLDGRTFDSSRERGQEFRFKLGRGEVIKGLDEGIKKVMFIVSHFMGKVLRHDKDG